MGSKYFVQLMTLLGFGDYFPLTLVERDLFAPRILAGGEDLHRILAAKAQGGRGRQPGRIKPSNDDVMVVDCFDDRVLGKHLYDCRFVRRERLLDKDNVGTSGVGRATWILAHDPAPKVVSLLASPGPPMS